MQERQIEVKNLKINYKVFGNPAQGKTLLVLHGWPSKSDRWIKVAELLAVQNIQIIVPDLPGFGESQEPAAAWTINQYVEWLHEFVQSVPELGQGFHLAGHSFGGALAAKYAIQYNQHIKKLFLISAACVRSRTAAKKMWHRLAKMGKVLAFLPYYELGRKAFYKFIIRKSDYPNISPSMRQTYLNVISDDLSQGLFFIKVPTIIIWGDKDESTPLEQAKFIQSKISGSQLIIIPGGTHALQLGNPELLAQRIAENIV
ncbi:MAG: hypothetical protein A3A12_00930 [Candidatus Staskawiczbacteria bacterium RIFCSPLOWO2_01_FULL_43_17b]|nr:MAG: hypothetical protein A3A12_00930 [Candidatus Staskawiczbacteria bacterium RIFCSPLOWO2_01_FULL_43_17b]